MSTKVIISLELDSFIYDLDEAHTELGLILHESLLPELARAATILRARWLVSSDCVGVPVEVTLPGSDLV